MPLLKEETTASYPLTVAKDKFSALTAQANATDSPFVVLKGGKPWVEVRPLAAVSPEPPDAISIEPVRRHVGIADLETLFVEYDSSLAPISNDSIWGDYPEQLIEPTSGSAGRFVPAEDGFAGPVGREEL